MAAPVSRSEFARDHGSRRPKTEYTRKLLILVL